MFHYAVNDCKLSPDWFASLFLKSGYSEQFSKGNPGVISGQSGIELARKILTKLGCGDDIDVQSYTEERSPEYWAGWALAEYQWYSCRSFAYIFEKIKLSEIIGMYPLFHEMDISHFIDAVEKKCASAEHDTHLKIIREAVGLSQSELAFRSGVNLRSIQMYEQRANSIDKAQSGTLFKLARTLGCSIEDLLENPHE